MRWISFGLIMISLVVPSVADDDDRADDAKKKAAAQRLVFMKESAKVYKLGRHAKSQKDQTELKLIENPLLRWSNPVSNVPDGTLFIWTEPDGRPAAAAQVFIAAGTQDNWLHEFQSLSLHPFSAKRNSVVVWSPTKPGVQMKPLPNAPPPAKTPVARKTQLRSMARRFAAKDDFEGKSRWQLRMLARPLHNYGKAGSEILDGALFAFAHGTDPEAFLLLEARTTKDGCEWHYGLAPMTAYALRVTLDDEFVWDAPYRKPPWNRTKPFFITGYQPSNVQRASSLLDKVRKLLSPK